MRTLHSSFKFQQRHLKPIFQREHHRCTRPHMPLEFRTPYTHTKKMLTLANSQAPSPFIATATGSRSGPHFHNLLNWRCIQCYTRLLQYCLLWLPKYHAQMPPLTSMRTQNSAHITVRKNCNSSKSNQAAMIQVCVCECATVRETCRPRTQKIGFIAASMSQNLP